MGFISGWMNKGRYRHWYVIGAGVSAVVTMSGISEHDIEIAYETIRDFLVGLDQDYVEDHRVTKQDVRSLYIGN